LNVTSRHRIGARLIDMRETILLSEHWKYHADAPSLYPDPNDIVRYLEGKTECRKSGPASRSYSEAPSWEDVQIPHDYIISQAPEKGNNWAEGHFHYHNAWYRTHFSLDSADEGRRIALLFEGVATHAEVYVNGCLAGRNFCGYTPFELDITSFVLYGQDNVIAVYVDSSSSHEGWWYQGGGIYRDVWLQKGDLAHILWGGVFVHPEYLEHEKWRVPMDVELRNDDIAERSLDVECEGFSPDGKSMFLEKAHASVPAWSTYRLSLAANADSIHRWDVDSPVLYSLETRVYDHGVLIDSQTDVYGYRTFAFKPEGFFLNGRKLLIKGENGHQDYGLTGKVMPRRAAYYRARLYKEMGVNAVRCSHYPHTRHLMDAYDELGFVVMAENRWYSDEPEAMRQLETLIRMERNRPSVVLWSAGNEEPLHAEERGVRIARRMFARMRQLDPTRPVTTVVCHDPVNAPVLNDCDVICVNYNLNQYDALHEKYPHKPFVAGETCATGTVRGWYGDTVPETGRFSAYDHDTNENFLGREKTWRFIMERPWVAGAFQWDGVEHRGEGRWPRLCSVSGAIDLYLQKKDAFFQNQSHWSDQPMVHLLPHWNHRGAEGRPIPVWVYSNCEEAELFLNGQSLGRRKIKPFVHEAWAVPYQAGKLSVVGYIHGEQAAEDHQETTGPATALRLIIDSVGDRADGRDVALLTCVCTDGEGREVPDASPLIRFETNRYGTILGTGADVCDHVPAHAPVRRMWAGRCSVCVRVGKEAGTLTVIARADGLASAYVDIHLK
jgi:beta-galactosidase